MPAGRRDAAARMVLTAACLFLAVVVVAFAWPNARDSDLFQFWYAGHVVLIGGSPYDPAAWAAAGAYGDLAHSVVANCTPTPLEPACVWVYPPATAFLFVPFALLDAPTGMAVLEAAIVALGLASLVVLARWMRAPTTGTPFIAFAACLISQPFIFDLRSAHFEGLGLLGLVALADGLAHRRAVSTAAGALALSAKPHLYLLVAAAAIVWLVRRRQWSSLVFGAAVLFAVQAAALLRFPDAPGAMLTRSASKVDLGWSSTWAFGAGLLPDAPALGIAAVLGMIAAALVVAVRHAPHARTVDVLVAGAAAASLAVSPYVHPYDLMVLFPAFVLTVALAGDAKAAARGLIVSLGVAMIAVGTWVAIAANRAGVAQGLPGALAPAIVVLLAVACVSAANAARGRAVAAG